MFLSAQRRTPSPSASVFERAICRLPLPSSHSVNVSPGERCRLGDSQPGVTDARRHNRYVHLTARDGVGRCFCAPVVRARPAGGGGDSGERVCVKRLGLALGSGESAGEAA